VTDRHSTLDRSPFDRTSNPAVADTTALASIRCPSRSRTPRESPYAFGGDRRTSRGEHLEHEVEESRRSLQAGLQKDAREEGSEERLDQVFGEPEGSEMRPRGHVRYVEQGLWRGAHQPCDESQHVDPVAERRNVGGEGVGDLGRVPAGVGQAVEASPGPDQGAGVEKPQVQGIIVQQSPGVGI
jgi:hypothetical protein